MDRLDMLEPDTGIVRDDPRRALDQRGPDGVSGRIAKARRRSDRDVGRSRGPGAERSNNLRDRLCADRSRPLQGTTQSLEQLAIVLVRLDLDLAEARNDLAALQHGYLIVGHFGELLIPLSK